MRTGELTQKVLSHYGAVEGDNTRKYITLTQVRAATGWADATTADVLVMGNWPSSGNELEGFEVKVSRSDWLNEVNKSDKGESIRKHCDRWWLVVSDQSFVKDGELPEDWGMMSIVRGKLTVIKKAPKLTPLPMPNVFIASMLRSDASETIPIDVHNDKLKDAVRDAEAECKNKYTALLEYVKFLNKKLGIQIRLDEKYDYKVGKKFFEKWTAIIPNAHRWGYHGDDKIIGLIKSAIEDDLGKMRSKMDTVEMYAKEIVELSAKTKAVESAQRKETLND